MLYENTYEYVNYSNVPIAGIVNESNYFIAPGSDYQIFSAYSQMVFTPFPFLKIVGGLRIEKALAYDLLVIRNQGYEFPDENGNTVRGTKNATDITLLPRIGVIYKFNDKNIIKLLIGKAEKRPDPVVIYEDLMDIERGEKTSGYSSEGYIKTRELNYISFINDNLIVNTSIYYNTLKNLIVKKNAVVDSILRAWLSNSGEMSTWGAESTVKIVPINGLDVEFSAMYQKTRDESLDINASFSPDFIGRLRLAYNITDAMNLAVKVEYMDEMLPFYNPTLRLDSSYTELGYVGRTAEKTNDYVKTDFYFSWKDFLDYGGVNLKFHVYNIFDQKYYYPTFSRNNLWINKGTLGYGRTVLISLEKRF